MTVVELLGCILITFGPPASMFVVTVAGNALRVILLMASAFFWLMSLLFSSLLWFIPMEEKSKFIMGVIVSVFFQELFRLLFYVMLKKARPGLEAVSNQGRNERKPLNMLSIYYAAGLGYGLVSGAFATVNIYRDLNGPGTVGIEGDSQYFFLITSFVALAFILLHSVWGVVFMGSLDSHDLWRRIVGPLGVVASHFIASGVTLLNYKEPGKAPLYGVSITIPYIMVIIMALWAYNIAGGSGRSLKHFVQPPTRATVSRRAG